VIRRQRSRGSNWARTSLGDFVHPLLILLDAEGVIAAASDEVHGLARTAEALAAAAEIEGEDNLPGRAPVPIERRTEIVGR
jgi:hypothetical protein